MDASGRHAWVPAALAAGAVYILIGRVFALPTDNVGAWRLAAWVVSGLVFASHIGYECFRLHHPAVRSAWHTSVAAALGGFGLAVAANIHDVGSVSGYRTQMLAALVVWPLLTGVPAFLVAFGAAALLTRFAKRT